MKDGGVLKCSKMRPAVIISCVLVNFLQTGQLAFIKTEETVLAAVGDEASLSCQLTEPKDVLQVTWQKVYPDGEMNLATFTKRFGSRVRPDLDGKMDFQHEALQSCSVVIRKVTEEDEGCYRCLFNTYPSGALIGRTCLTLYELHEPILDARRSNSPAASVVSCSATGRPAPTVILTVLHQNLTFSQYNSTSVTNSNGTVTVTTTALLSAFSSTEVGCSVSVLSAAPRELLVTVPGLTETSEDVWGVTIAVVLFCGSLVASVSIFRCRKMHHNRKLQVEKETEEQTKHAPSVEQFMQEKTTREVTWPLTKRQTSKQQSPVTPTTPDVESCSPEAINLHQKLKGRKSF